MLETSALALAAFVYMHQTMNTDMAWSSQVNCRGASGSRQQASVEKVQGLEAGQLAGSECKGSKRCRPSAQRHAGGDDPPLGYLSFSCTATLSQVPLPDLTCPALMTMLIPTECGARLCHGPASLSQGIRPDGVAMHLAWPMKID